MVALKVKSIGHTAHWDAIANHSALKFNIEV
jgi:hypothetical protein